MTSAPIAQPAIAPTRVRLGETLVLMGRLSRHELDHALNDQASHPGRRLGTALVSLGLATEEDVAAALASVHAMPLLDVSTISINRDIARLVPRSAAERLGILAYGRVGDRLQVAVADPVDVVALDDVRAVTGVTGLDAGVATPRGIREALQLIWAQREDEDVIKEFAEVNRALVVEDDPDSANDAVTVRLVDRLLSLAVRERASDVHIEPQRDGVHVRIRVDGLLRHVMDVPRAGYSAMAARLKIVAALDVIERRLPQDGGARLRVDGSFIDVRVSTLPSIHGEKVVVRLLPPADQLPTLLALGHSDVAREKLLEATSLSQGLILITGPTGSGKTNTLYAALAEGVGRGRNVLTLEDPVEIELPGITQVQVDDRIGMTFARGLRAALRQDPDVILVGEIRDQETAELAVRAAMTGHLVLSTLHTNDAAAAVTRLADMGVPAYLVASSLALVASQRLVRVPCPECGVPDTRPELGSFDDYVPGSAHQPPEWIAPVGCPSCKSTGYQGRTAVLELLTITAEIRSALLRGAGEHDVRRMARASGAPSLFAEGVDKARRGQTTMAEVFRALPADTVVESQGA